MKFGIGIFLSITLILSGCSTALTSGGAAVRSIGAGEDTSMCDFLGVITAKSPELALTPAQEAKYVMNDARNKVAERGGTHIKILTENHTALTGATINAEAYRCK